MSVVCAGLLAAATAVTAVAEQRQAAARPAAGLAAAHPGDVGIASDPAVLFASGFEDGFAGWTRANRKVCAIEEDAPRAHAGKKCLRLTATRGLDTGGETALRLERGVDRLFLRFYCRFDADACWPHHFVKLRALAPGFDGPAGVAPPGDKGFWTGIEPLRGAWRFYTYWHAMRGWNNPGGEVPVNDDGTPNTGKNDFYGNTFQPAAQPEIPRAQWICVEAMVKANTPGRSDGEMAFWIDGREMGRFGPGTPPGKWVRNTFVTTGKAGEKLAPFEGFDFRTSAELKLNEIGLLWYVSEEYAAKGQAERNVVWFDDVVVATEYIGPMVTKTAR